MFLKTSLRTFCHLSIEHDADSKLCGMKQFRASRILTHQATRISCILPWIWIWIRINSTEGPWIDHLKVTWAVTCLFFYFRVCVCLAAVRGCECGRWNTQTGCSSRGGELRGAFGFGGGGWRWRWRRWLTHKVPAAAINRPICWFKDEHAGPLTHSNTHTGLRDHVAQSVAAVSSDEHTPRGCFMEFLQSHARDPHESYIYKKDFRLDPDPQLTLASGRILVFQAG